MARTFIKLIGIIVTVVFFNSVSAAEVDRGQLLYENHCGKCHGSSVHQRADRKAKNLVDISKWVIEWQHHLGLNWELDDVRQVTRYLNNQFYHFPSEPGEAH